MKANADRNLYRTPSPDPASRRHSACPPAPPRPQRTRPLGISDQWTHDRPSFAARLAAAGLADPPPRKQISLPPDFFTSTITLKSSLSAPHYSAHLPGPVRKRPSPSRSFSSSSSSLRSSPPHPSLKTRPSSLPPQPQQKVRTLDKTLSRRSKDTRSTEKLTAKNTISRASKSGLNKKNRDCTIPTEHRNCYQKTITPEPWSRRLRPRSRQPKSVKSSTQAKNRCFASTRTVVISRLKSGST